MYSSYTQRELNKQIIMDILNKVFPIHLANFKEIDYLERVYKGYQPILGKTKEVRPAINNIVVENYAYFMTEFKKSYVFGKPLKYVQLGEIVSDEISTLNKYMTKSRKHTKDTLLSESLYVSGIAHLIVLPSKGNKIPFEIEVLDSKRTFLFYKVNLLFIVLISCSWFFCWMTDENNIKRNLFYRKI